VTYDTYYPYSMSLMIGMSGKAGLAAERKWKTLSHGLPCPNVIEDAVDEINNGAFDLIQDIVVRKEGKYWNVINAHF